jgi:hypothetical protein
MVVSFVLFCVLGFSIVPLAIRVCIFMQIKIGNAELFLVRFLQTHEQSVVFGERDAGSGSRRSVRSRRPVDS